MALDTTTTKLLIPILIVAIGYFISMIGSRLILAISKKQDTISVRRVQILKVFRYLVMIFTILTALIYLKVDLTKDIGILRTFLFNTYNFMPKLFVVILVLVLSITIVNLISFGLRRIFDASGITELMLEQNKEHFLNGILGFVRFSLYLFAALFLFNIFGINIQGIARRRFKSTNSAFT